MSGVAMFVSGVAAAIMFDGFRIVGVSVATAGVIGLVTLLRQVRSWIDATATNGTTTQEQPARRR